MRILFVILAILPQMLCCSPSALRVGMELSYPPFEMVCKDATPCGISVDFAYDLGKYLNLNVHIYHVPFIGLVPELKNGTIDLAISSMTVTEKRKKAIDFSEPYVTTGLCLLISKQSSVNEIEDADQSDRVLVVKSGTSGELYAATHIKKARVRVLDRESSCVLEVVQGKADAFIYDQLSVFVQWQKYPNETRALLVPFQKEYWAVGVHKGNLGLLNQINLFIKNYRKAGGFMKLEEKYLPLQKAAFKKLGIPMVFGDESE